LRGRLRTTGPCVWSARLIAASSSCVAVPTWIGGLAGVSRTSRLSRHGRNRAGALRRVRGAREANRLRSQERVVMERLLPEKVGRRRKKGTARPAPSERQAGKALTNAISQPLLLLTSMRNGERNHATTCLAFFQARPWCGDVLATPKATSRRAPASCNESLSSQAGYEK